MYSLALIIFVGSEKKAFEHFPIGSNVNLMSCGGGHLGFPIGKKNRNNQTESKLDRNVHWMVLYKV
jgi:hypothetical protein